MKRKKCSSALESGRVAHVQPDQYEQQLTEKIDKVKQIFKGIQIPEMEIFQSPPAHYRQRCEFRVFHDGDASYYVMFEKQSESDTKPKMMRKDSFPVASRLINELMVALMSHVLQSPVLRNRLYTAAFHTTLSGEAMITLVYHKVLDEAWRAVAESISLSLATESPSCTQSGVNIIGRSRKQKIVIGNDFVHEQFAVNGRDYIYKQVEGCFTQPNGAVCAHMLSWAQTASNPKTSPPANDLLELYCGNCNFTIPLAQNFRHVIATEVSRAAVQAGKQNLETNHVDNVLLARMSSEEFVEKWKSGDLGTRLHHRKSTDFNLSTIFVDPPRAGLDADTVQLLKTFDTVLYISCNPFTLYADISALVDTHAVTRFALFDQFPYTGHVECGVILDRKEWI